MLCNSIYCLLPWCRMFPVKARPCVFLMALPPSITARVSATMWDRHRPLFSLRSTQLPPVCHERMASSTALGQRTKRRMKRRRATRQL